MAVKEESLIIDLDKENYIPSFQVKQNDDVILKIKLTKDNKFYNFLGNTAKLYARKPNGTFIEQNKNISNNNTEIIIKCKNSVFDTPGLCIGEIELKDSNGVITTANFYYIVTQKAVSFKDIKSIIDVDSVKDLEGYISAFKLSLETFKNNLKGLTDLNSNKDKLELENNNAKENIKSLSSINIKALENIKNINGLDIPNLKNNIEYLKNWQKNLKIDSTNLISNSGYCESLTYWNKQLGNATSKEMYIQKGNNELWSGPSLECTSINPNGWYVLYNSSLKDYKFNTYSQYTLSGVIWANEDMKIDLIISDGDSKNLVFIETLELKQFYNEVSITFTPKCKGNDNLIRFSFKGSGRLFIPFIKLEKGKFETGWCYSLNDLNKRFNSKCDKKDLESYLNKNNMGDLINKIVSNKILSTQGISEGQISIGPLIIKYGWFNIESNGTRTYNFPVAFPNGAFFGIAANYQNDNKDLAFTGVGTRGAVTKTGITAYNIDKQRAQAVYIALGN